MLASYVDQRSRANSRLACIAHAKAIAMFFCKNTAARLGPIPKLSLQPIKDEHPRRVAGRFYHNLEDGLLNLVLCAQPITSHLAFYARQWTGN
jgi:hypothetical protein